MRCYEASAGAAGAVSAESVAAFFSSSLTSVASAAFAAGFARGCACLGGAGRARLRGALHDELDDGLFLVVQADADLVRPDAADGVLGDLDSLLLDLEALLFELHRHVGIVHRPEELAVLTRRNAEADLFRFKPFLQAGRFQALLFLPLFDCGPLVLERGEELLGVRDDELLGKQKIAGIAVRHVLDVALFAEADHVLIEDYLHLQSLLSRQSCRPAPRGSPRRVAAFRIGRRTAGSPRRRPLFFSGRRRVTRDAVPDPVFRQSEHGDRQHHKETRAR